MSKIKVLAFNDYYYPATDVGGPVTSIANAVNALHDEFDFYIEAYNHNFSDHTPFPGIETEKWYDMNGAKVMYHSDGVLDFKYKKMEEFIDTVKPDIMWFSGLLMPNKLHNAIRIGEKRGIGVLISPRGEASPDRMVLKGYKKFPYAALVSLLGIYKKKNVFFHATSDDEIVGLKKYFHIKPDRITEVANIGVTVTRRPEGYKKVEGKVRAMFISRIHEVKNLDFAIKAFSKLSVNGEYDIYGPIETPEYWQKCEELIKAAPQNVTIKYCGKVNPMDVAGVYQKYDCFLFPTINENYGHVIAESLANGCPVVLSKGTTPWDDIDGQAGFVCRLDSEKEFVDALTKIAEMNQQTYLQFMDSTYDYYKRKTADDDAVIGHRDMFHKIVREMK